MVETIVACYFEDGTSAKTRLCPLSRSRTIGQPVRVIESRQYPANTLTDLSASAARLTRAQSNASLKNQRVRWPSSNASERLGRIGRARLV